MIRYGSIRIDRKNKIIYNKTRHYKFRPSSSNRSWVSFDLLQHLLLGGGKTLRNLFNVIYNDDPEGGPADSRNHLAVILCQLEKRGVFRYLDMQLHSEKRGGVTHYWVAPK